jgi:L-arabinonolactonase
VSDVRCVLQARALLGEGPLWDPEDRALYWVDIKGQMVHRFDPSTGRDMRWPTPEPVGSLARRVDGGLVVALRSGFHFLDLDSGAIQAVCAPEPDRRENRLNDGKPDRRGRFWAGSMHDPETAATGALPTFLMLRALKPAARPARRRRSPEGTSRRSLTRLGRTR